MLPQAGDTGAGEWPPCEGLQAARIEYLRHTGVGVVVEQIVDLGHDSRVGGVVLAGVVA